MDGAPRACARLGETGWSEDPGATLWRHCTEKASLSRPPPPCTETNSAVGKDRGRFPRPARAPWGRGLRWNFFPGSAVPHWTPAACSAGLEASGKGGQNVDVLIDGYQQAPRRPAPLAFATLSWRRPLRRGDSDAPEFRAARAAGLGRDVGLCVRPRLAPGQLGGWEAGRLEVCRLIKRNCLFLCQTRMRQVGRGEKKGKALLGPAHSRPR